MDRRRFLWVAGAAFIVDAAIAAPQPLLTVYKSAGCTCCEGWIAHMRRSGFRTQVSAVNDLSVEWRRRGVPDALSSCHMGVTAGFVVVGHVPASDVQRLLRLRPKALGLSVPGMPDGSPGMERPDGRREAYSTLLLLPGGRSQLFARHG